MRLTSWAPPDVMVVTLPRVWPIGTGQIATPETPPPAHRLIRGQAKGSFGKEAAINVCILYGGNVKPDNAKSLMARPVLTACS